MVRHGPALRNDVEGGRTRHTGQTMEECGWINQGNTILYSVSALALRGDVTEWKDNTAPRDRRRALPRVQQTLKHLWTPVPL